MIERRALGSFLSLLEQEDSLLVSLEGAQTDMAEAANYLEKLKDFETEKIEYCQEKLRKATLRRDMILSDLEEVRGKIRDYIRYKGVVAEG